MLGVGRLRYASPTILSHAGVDRETQVAGLEGLLENLAHPGALASARPDPVIEATSEAHHGGPQGRMPEEHGDVRAEREALEVLEILGRAPPVHDPLEQRLHDAPRNALDPAEHVREVLGGPHRHAEAAAAEVMVVTP